MNLLGSVKKKYYCEIWPFINDTYGILYKIFTPNGLGEFECCDEMFEFDYDKYDDSIHKMLFPEMPSEMFSECISMRLVEEYYADFMALLEMKSSKSTIAFLCRGQSDDKEVILGTYQLKDFYKKLCLGEVYTNVCYLITSDCNYGEKDT